MKKILYKSFLLASFSIFTLSCFGGDDDGDMPSQCKNIQHYIDEYVTASNAFAANPTYQNCSNAKSKGYILLNTIRACSEFYDYSSYEEGLEALENIDCSQF